MHVTFTPWQSSKIASRTISKLGTICSDKNGGHIKRSIDKELVLQQNREYIKIALNLHIKVISVWMHCTLPL